MLHNCPAHLSTWQLIRIRVLAAPNLLLLLCCYRLTGVLPTHSQEGLLDTCHLPDSDQLAVCLSTTYWCTAAPPAQNQQLPKGLVVDVSLLHIAWHAYCAQQRRIYTCLLCCDLRLPWATLGYLGLPRAILGYPGANLIQCSRVGEVNIQAVKGSIMYVAFRLLQLHDDSCNNMHRLLVLWRIRETQGCQR